jgi:ClpP class serine protease
MQNKSKAWIAILAIFLFIVVVSVGLVVGGRAVSRHLPGNALLTLNISGPIPQRTADDPLAELFAPQPTSLIDLRDALVRAAGDKRVRGVRVKVSELQAGFATVQEVRSLLAAVGRAGKPTWAYLDTAGEFASGNLEYLLATGCRRVAVNPIGDVNLVGLAARSPFIRGTFDKLLIEPDFPGIGDYKTARFFYTEKDFTAAHREMFGWLVDSLQRQMVAGIADGRGLTAEQVTALIQRGPFLGPEAVEEHLIDELVDWPTFAASTTKGPAGTRSEVSLRQYLRAGRPDRRGVPIAVVVAEGGIQRGESGYSPLPLFGGDVMGSSTIARAFQQVRDSKARAVIFRINSGGGSAVASEIIRAEMVKTAIAAGGRLDGRRRRFGRLLDRLRRQHRHREPRHHHCLDRRVRRAPGNVEVLGGKARRHLGAARRRTERRHLRIARCLDARAAAGGGPLSQPDLRRVSRPGLRGAPPEPRGGRRDRPRPGVHRSAGGGKGVNRRVGRLRRRARQGARAGRPQAGRGGRAAVLPQAP